MALPRILVHVLLALWACSLLVSGVAGEAAPRKTKEQRQEESLFKSLMNCPLCKGKEAVACFKRVRYEEGRSWSECLEECIDNPLIRSTFQMLLPKESATEKASNLDSTKALKDMTLSQATAGLTPRTEL
mmetsp:Transcript_42462/g.79745  ORF Transcript_42462/g.79745 Transcript_42462/m.79745 type:complete len:130 (-) Transcript_42462:101-490(-)